MRTRTFLTISCECCHTPFLIEPSRLNHGRGRYCSPSCQYTAIKERNRVTLECPVCKGFFEVMKKEFNERTPTYCSVQCTHQSEEWKRKLGDSLRASTKARAQQIKSVKAMNESRTSAMRSQSISSAWENAETRKRMMDGIKLRSESEEWKNAGHFQKGSAHPKYKSDRIRRDRTVEGSRYPYKKWRENVLARDNRICQECFKPGSIAHHIKPWRDYPELRYELSNGMTLCAPCHKKTHAKQ